MPTNFGDKLGILADLWINYKSDDEFADFVEYNDIGLPLAYCIHTELAQPGEQAEMFIDETFNLLCGALGIDPDKEYETLNQMFEESLNS